MRLTPEQVDLMRLKVANNSKQSNFKYSDIKPDHAIFIPHEVKSKKNSKRLIPYKKGEQCKCRQISSEAYLDYAKSSGDHYKACRLVFAQMIKDLQPPYNIEFTFVMSTKRKFDYNNLAQGVQDLMVEHGWLEDDNYTFVKPFFGDVIVDKENPGVYIKVLNA